MYEDALVLDQQNGTYVRRSTPTPIEHAMKIYFTFIFPTGPRETIAYRLAIRLATFASTGW